MSYEEQQFTDIEVFSFQLIIIYRPNFISKKSFEEFKNNKK